MLQLFTDLGFKRFHYDLGQLGFVEEGQAEYTCDEFSPGSWDEVYYDMKVETGEDELSASSNLKKQKLWPRRNLPAFLRLKDTVETTTDILPSIDSLPISLPIGYGPLEEFDQVELLTKFKLQTKQNGHLVAKDTSAHGEVNDFSYFRCVTSAGAETTATPSMTSATACN